VTVGSRRRRLKNSDRPNDPFNPNKRIENAYTQFGRIANSAVRQNAPFNPNKRIENAYTQYGRIANPTE